MSHTPGPWTKRGGGPSCIKGGDRDDVPFHVVKVDKDEQGRRRTAFVAVCDATTLNNEANAHLVSAAPDLLASLREMEDMLHLWMTDNAGTRELDMLERCEAAIAKAEGR